MGKVVSQSFFCFGKCCHIFYECLISVAYILVLHTLLKKAFLLKMLKTASKSTFKYHGNLKVTVPLLSAVESSDHSRPAVGGMASMTNIMSFLSWFQHTTRNSHKTW